MGKKEDRRMSNFGFKMMSLMFAVYYRFKNFEKDMEKIGIKEGQTVLDFGCGPGYYTIYTAKTVGEHGKVYALDIHPLAIETVEEKAKEEGLTNITTILSDRDTGLANESVDVILLVDTLHLIKDKQELLKELHRVVKPDGVLSIGRTHMKVKDIIETVEKNGLFHLKTQHGDILNFKRGWLDQISLNS
jgi:ubiquinone/menaquinone biosynthesis C-methylase UbiE